MARIEVTAKITGVHAATGVYVTEGERYLIDEADFGEEVFKRVPAQKDSPKTKKEA